jgi:hypothetical protein
VADYLLGALDRGGVAIVIATPEHRREFETRLGQAGVNLAAARGDGSYVALDAGQTLAELTAADGLDGAAFGRVIGGVIRRAAASGRAVRAFGELVALLWEDGLVNDAVQLEEMWEELAGRHPFSLFCGYRADSVTRDVEAFADVCRLHEEIVGSRSGTTRTLAVSREAHAERLGSRRPDHRCRPGGDRTRRQRHPARPFRLHRRLVHARRHAAHLGPRRGRAGQRRAAGRPAARPGGGGRAGQPVGSRVARERR